MRRQRSRRNERYDANVIVDTKTGEVTPCAAFKYPVAISAAAGPHFIEPENGSCYYLG